MDSEIKDEVDAASKIAKTEAEIPMEELAGDVYASNLEGKIRGTLPWNHWEHKRLGPAVNMQ